MAVKASAQVSIVDVSDGQTGATGKGISSTSPEYYLSSSKTTQTGGSWSTTPPTWSSGKYLWVRQIVTYTDSSVSRTQPYCDTSWEAVKEVQVGGRNIATGTATLTIGTGGHSVGHWRKTGNGTVENIDISDSPVASINKGVRITSINSTSQIGICQDGVPLNSDDIYTVSCWVRSNSSSGVPCRLQSFYKSSTDNSGATQDIMITDSWKRISFVSIRSPQITGAYYAAYVVLRPTEVGNYIDVCGIKFEAGNKPTDWSPAPEDVEADAKAKADEAAKTATNYMKFQNNGLVIGNLTAGTLGKNVLIDNDSVDIRNGDAVLASYGTKTTIGATTKKHVVIDDDGFRINNGNTLLSQFTDSEVYLGKNTFNAKIVLGNDIGTILCGNMQGIRVLDISSDVLTIGGEVLGATNYAALIRCGGDTGQILLSAKETKITGNVYIGGGSGNLIGICQIVKMGSPPETIKYQPNRTKALIEFWKTSVGGGSGSHSYTIYDSAYVTGLSNKMTAVTHVNVKSGPDFAFTYSISAAGAITVSGNFSKYRITYFN